MPRQPLPSEPEPGLCDSMSAAVEASSSGADSAEPEEQEPETAQKPSAKADPTYLPAVEYFRSGSQFSIGDIEITPFTIPHDAADPCGFVFASEGVRMAVATDLGYMPPNVKAALKRIDVLLLESNHDLEMLKDGPYPWSVKQRVLSRVGHLSNLATAEFLERDYDGTAAYIVLGHLSESNNAPELARLSAEQALMNHPTLLGKPNFAGGTDCSAGPDLFVDKVRFCNPVKRSVGGAATSGSESFRCSRLSNTVE